MSSRPSPPAPSPPPTSAPPPLPGAGPRGVGTGGTGFIGAHVVRALLRRGYRVRCLVRSTSPRLTLQGLPVEVVQAPLERGPELTAALRGCRAVQHLAGIFDPSPGGVERMHAVHVGATRALCETALELDIPRLVLCSSSITMGFGTLEDPGNEQTPVRDEARLYPPGTALRAYYDTKREAEALVRTYVDRGLEAVIVNPDYVIGAWDVKPTSGALVLALGGRPVPCHPLGGKCFVAAEDCGVGHVLAQERGRPGRRYLLGLENHSYRSFLTLVAEVTGGIPPRIPVPRGLTRALGAAGGLAARTGIHRLAGLDPQVLASMQEPRYRDGSRAVRELGLPHTPLRVAIGRAWRWFHDHGYVDR